MVKRKWFSTDEILSYLRNIPDDVSECEDSGLECDDLCNCEQDSDSSFNNEFELAYQKAPILYLIYLFAFLSNLGCKMNLQHLKLFRK